MLWQMGSNIKNIFWLMGKNTQKHLPGPVKHEKELRWYESSRATKGGRGGTGHPAGLPALYFLATGTNGRCNFLQTHKPQRSQLESACKPSSATWRGQEVHTSHNSDLGRWQLYRCLVWLHCKRNKKFHYLCIFSPHVFRQPNPVGELLFHPLRKNTWGF